MARPKVLTLSSHANRLLWLTSHNPVTESKRELWTLANRKAPLDDICKKQLHQRAANLFATNGARERCSLCKLRRSGDIRISGHRVQVHNVGHDRFCIATAQHEVRISRFAQSCHAIHEVWRVASDFLQRSDQNCTSILGAELTSRRGSDHGANREGHEPNDVRIAPEFRWPRSCRPRHKWLQCLNTGFLYLRDAPKYEHAAPALCEHALASPDG